MNDGLIHMGPGLTVEDAASAHDARPITITRNEMIRRLRDLVRCRLIDASGNVRPEQELHPEFAAWIASDDGRRQLRHLRLWFAAGRGDLEDDGRPVQLRLGI